ncbi:acyltransferase [Flavobacterium luminosum]|uniref:Acyltransferase n=1 Tax=Flavobacterium luminosum TaxID=2949086 RepID=A0ABT0TNL9_9FLAO|nr:acyltransferase [Flavobacterium sp. HXWNR70]MCL9809097.1 acyltransferase [Flavobacterium sp. HXWNR70]
MLKQVKKYFKLKIFKAYDNYLLDKNQKELGILFSKFKKMGSNCVLERDFRILGPEHIEIGDNFLSLHRLRLEAIDQYNEEKFSPRIIIGNNVTFNTDCHIGCTNSIIIEDNCLFASRIYITDHHHGDTSEEMLEIVPNKRPLISKGPVLIKKNVWVGEGVCIMPNVTIGENSIIASNAVVTKNIPANSVVAGVPAIVIKKIK